MNNINIKEILIHNGYILFNGKLQKFNSCGCVAAFYLYNKVKELPSTKKYSFVFEKNNVIYALVSVSAKEILKRINIVSNIKNQYDLLQGNSIKINKLYYRLAHFTCKFQPKIRLPK